jgi:hypothetical protein
VNQTHISLARTRAAAFSDYLTESDAVSERDELESKFVFVTKDGK